MALLTLCAAVIIGLGTLVDYRLTRDELLERLQRESDTTIRAAMIDMESWLQGVESSTLLLARVLQQRDYSQAGLRVIFKAAKQAKAAGQRVAAANRKPHIDKVFEILKALPDMTVFANEAELDDYLTAMQERARGE